MKKVKLDIAFEVFRYSHCCESTNSSRLCKLLIKNYIRLEPLILMTYLMEYFYFNEYLTNHDRKDKDSNEIVDELEDRFRQGGGIRHTSDVDQSFHSKVVTANVSERRNKK